ncbi:hypothetical protein HHK36_003378 [Tetracentron sinense]|uniref:Uncharacterized protein n=1 Tax=Tetracentron sinense TaxID=13715 RepID=A0A834ZXJ3_TETSI|nr:hypothetical protein HHK36_003378 [Tetracentron sinense]
MGRQSNDPIVTHSSIALLQERFRQLQKVKEMREGRELLRLYSESDGVCPTIRHEPSRLFFHPELILPPRLTLHSSLSLRPNFQSKHAEFRAIEAPPLTNLWLKDTAIMHKGNNFDDSDVDTSLHL